MTRRELGALVGAFTTVPLQLRAQTLVPPPAPNNQGPVLDLADWSYQWYGVEHALLARGTVCNGMQMYVERWIPQQVRHPYPVVLVHGGYGQGTDWLSTPDGRRGWASHLVTEGYKVHLVDRPGQGRNPYHPWVHGNFDAQAQTFEATARSAQGTANVHTQWPGSGAAISAEIMQLTAGLGQPMPRNAAMTQTVWRTRGACCWKTSALRSSSRMETERYSRGWSRKNGPSWSKRSSRLSNRRMYYKDRLA